VAGAKHACAIQSQFVTCWGANDSGQLGNGTTTPSPTPVYISANVLSGASSLAAGAAHTCAVVGSGTKAGVKCWGDNTYGQLGLGTVPTAAPFGSPTPVSVPGLTNVAAVAAGAYFTCALMNDGSVQCWGANEAGQLGNGSVSPASSSAVATPAAVAGLSGAVAIRAGGSSACAASGGNVHCWGSNAAGQLGSSAGSPSPAPVLVPGVGGVVGAVEFAVGTAHACSEAYFCWGDDLHGDLGDGKTSPSSAPVQVSGFPAGIRNSPVWTAGRDHTCIALSVLDGGAVLCWGGGARGQLGNGGTADSSTPVVVSP
jgi:alpha-tubulin suppressor-like RCC1 family protein